MKKQKILTILALILTLALSVMLFACSKKDEPAKTDAPTEAAKDAQSEEKPEAEDKPETEEKLLFGFSQCTTDSPYYVTLQESAQKAIEDAGHECRVVNAADDIQKQNQDVKDLIQAGIKVLILNPTDSSGLAPAVAACEEAGVPIIVVDRPLDEGGTTFVGRDNVAMGQAVGEHALELLGGKGKATGKILELMGAGGNVVTNNRSDGFHAAFEGEDVEFVQSPYCDYNRAKAVEAAQDLLQGNPDVKLIYGHNDDMAIGGMQVAKQANIDAFVCGVDGLMEAVQLIADGEYDVTTMNDPASQGKLAGELAMKAAAGETLDSYYDAGTMLITKDNAKDLISDAMFASTEK